MENGLPARPAVHPSVAAFEAIDGYDDTELYAAGTGGALWRYDGAFWRQIPVTTNVRLTGITASADGTVYVCGQSGVLLRGRGDLFELIEHDEDIRYFWDVGWWKDRLFLLSSYVLYTWQDSKLSPYPFAGLREDESLPTTFLRFLRSPSWLWTVGDK